MTRSPEPSAPPCLGARRRSFTIWYEDFVRWDVGYFSVLSWAWPPEVMRPLGTVLTRVTREVESDDLRTVPIIARITFGGVASVLPVDDREGYKGRLFWAEPGQLIYSRIRAKQGSFTVVDPGLGRLAVSQEYPVYDIDHASIDVEFLKLALRSNAFLSLMTGLSHGGSTKTRMLPEQFEAMNIPVPPLPVQRRIVAAAATARSQVARLRAEADEREIAIGAGVLLRLGLGPPEIRGERPRQLTVWWSQLERWGVDYMIRLLQGTRDFREGQFPVVTLGEIAAVSYGIQKSPANRPAQDARPYLRVANVKRGRLDLAEIKYINVPESMVEPFLLAPGDVLFVEGNGSRKELGRAAIWGGQIQGCVHQNHLIKVRVQRAIVQPEFVELWFNSGPGREHFFRAAKTTSGLGTINSSEVRSAPVPLPPLDVQRQIVHAAAETRKEVDRLRAEASAIERAAKLQVEEMILGVKPS